MTITLRPQTEQLIRERVQRGEFESAGSIVEQAVSFFLSFGENDMPEAEFSEVKAAVDEGLQQGARGEGVSVEEFDRKMRAKYGIQR